MIYAYNAVFMVSIKKKTNQLTNGSRRSYTFEYNLKHDESELVPICKNMYLGILCLKESMLRNWVNSALNTRNIIDNWFNSLAKMLSHYCHKNTEKLYPEEPFKDVEDIYNVYTKKFNDCTLMSFNKTFFEIM